MGLLCSVVGVVGCYFLGVGGGGVVRLKRESPSFRPPCVDISAVLLFSSLASLSLSIGLKIVEKIDHLL